MTAPWRETGADDRRRSALPSGEFWRYTVRLTAAHRETLEKRARAEGRPADSLLQALVAELLGGDGPPKFSDAALAGLHRRAEAADLSRPARQLFDLAEAAAIGANQLDQWRGELLRAGLIEYRRHRCGKPDYRLRAEAEI